MVGEDEVTFEVWLTLSSDRMRSPTLSWLTIPEHLPGVPRSRSPIRGSDTDDPAPAKRGGQARQTTSITNPLGCMVSLQPKSPIRSLSHRFALHSVGNTVQSAHYIWRPVGWSAAGSPESICSAYYHCSVASCQLRGASLMRIYWPCCVGTPALVDNN